MDNKFIGLTAGLFLMTVATVKADPAPVVVGHLAGNDAVVQQNYVSGDNDPMAAQSGNTNGFSGQAYQAASAAPAPAPTAASQTPIQNYQNSATEVQMPKQTTPSQSQLGLLDQMQQMQQQMRDMQGQLEVQSHQIKLLEKAIANMDAPTTTGASAANGAATSVNGQAAEPLTAQQANQALAEEKDYQQAYQFLTSKQYDQAQIAMGNYLQKYPKGKYAANAHYWLGELALIGGNANDALEQFNTVVKQFNQSPKVADSMLKIGFIYYDERQFKKAADQLNQIMAKFPNTSSAQLAQQKLQMMKTSGTI